jgi:signal transduction histidine kinase
VASASHETPASAADGYAKLLSLASHEFRTPASVIGGYLRMLLRDTESSLSDRQRRMIEEAEKSCTRMVALLAEMSDLAKLDAGTAAMNRTDFDLFRVVADVAPTVLESSDRGVHLDVRGAPEGAPLAGDADRMRHAFAALCRAVLREQPASCRVAVDRRVTPRTASVVIAHEDEVEQAWAAPPTPFNEHRGGLGLALPIARRVIELHGGRVASVFVPRPAGPSTTPAGAILISFDLGEPTL